MIKMVNDWDKTVLNKKILINPNRNLSRGQHSPFVSMQDIEVGNRNIFTFGYREFRGSGSKFKNGDTLLARITPCLENGKTVYVNFLNGNEVAHGSTEFIVLSGIEDISDNLFITWLEHLNFGLMLLLKWKDHQDVKEFQ